MYYQTTFTIRDPSERRLKGNELLNAVKVLTEETLKLSPDESNTETLTCQDAAYWELTVERPTLDESSNSIRLEVRAYSINDEVTAQIATRYLRSRTDEVKELPTFPPGLLTSLSKRFECTTGNTVIRDKPTVLTTYSIKRFINRQINNPKRTVPLLVVTKNQQGQTEADPERLQRAIAGTGHVAVMGRGTERALRETIGRATYNGKMRLINPNLEGRHEYYNQQPELRQLVSQCLELTKEPDFDAPFAQATQYVRNQVEQTIKPDEAITVPDPAVIKELNVYRIRDKQNEQKINDTNQENKRLKEKLEEIEQSDEHSTTRESLQAELDSMEDKIQELQEMLKAERSKKSYPETIGTTINLNGSKVHNVTVINHAINIARDPLRHYITGRLRNRFGKQTGEKMITTIDMRHTSARKVKEKPEANLDINDFANVVSNYQTCFNNRKVKAPELARMLREVKTIRNRASHPPLYGIPNEETIDKLHLIRDVMQYLNIEQEAIDSLINMQARHLPTTPTPAPAKSQSLQSK